MMHSRSTSSSSSPSYHESKSHASFGKRTVSIRIYVSTVAFLGCIMVWMQLANTNFDVNNNNNNNGGGGGGGGGGGVNVVDNPTIRSIYYGQSVKRKTSSSSTIINDGDDDEDLIALRILVWDQGKILKEQEKQLSILQKRFDDTPQSSSSSSSSSSSLSENDEKKTTKTQVQQTLVRSLGGGKTGSTSLIVSLTDRLSRLETMTKGYMNWITDPFTGSRAIYKCKNEKDISEHYVCFDDFPPTHTPLSSSSSSSKEEEVVVIVSSSPDSNSSSTKSKNKKCVVYDYGIREQPQFGLYFAKNYPQCEVHAFDPSPISVKWWNTDTNDVVLKELKALPNYFFHDWGAGGVDGTIQLFGYNWGQVSSVRVPFFTSSLCGYGNDKFNRYNESFISDPKNYHLIQCLSSTDIKYRYSAPTHDFSYFDEETQKHDDFDETHLLNVKTLKTTMEELGHTHIDVLKMDVEGSEYQFLESAIDEYDCPPVSQMSIEWHHYSFDPRYGGGSSREMNSIVTYLHDRCNVKTYQGEEEGGYCINKAFAKDSGLRMCYMTTSLMTVPPS